MYWDRALTQADVNALQANTLSAAEVDLNKKSIDVYFDEIHKTLSFQTNLEGVKQVIMHNAYGQEIYLSEFKSTVSVATFASGIYFVTVRNGETRIVKKVIIR